MIKCVLYDLDPLRNHSIKKPHLRQPQYRQNGIRTYLGQQYSGDQYIMIIYFYNPSTVVVGPGGVLKSAVMVAKSAQCT